MPKVKISEYSATANSNTDVASINIDEGCAPSGINNAIRAIMGHLKDFQQGTNGDPFNGPVNGTLGATTASTANVTTLTTSSTVTHNGGTINGVAYLNGAKALTTGSALVFDGTNLGVGVTPSAWGSGYKALQINNGGLVTNTGGTFTAVVANAFFDGTNYKYVSTAAASLYRQNAGVHDWQTAASGTAGNNITFTQAMTLDASGNLLVGTTTANGVLTLRGTSQASHLYTGAPSALQFGQFNTTGEASINNNANAALLFATNNTERARIDSSGNLLVGKTGAAGARVDIVAASGGAGLQVRNDTAAITTVGVWNDATSGNNTFVNFYTEAGATTRGSITYNRAGGLVMYNQTSDYRAKDISGPIIDSGALIDSVPVYMGKMKDATQERPMFIAHETPVYAHTGEKDAVDKDGKPVYQQMDASALIPVMWAEIQSLRKRLAAANL
jgi:hypothetical protein